MANKGTVYINGLPSKNKVEGEAKKEVAKLDKIAREANHVIYELSSAFPFQMFPDRIIIDENKVTIVRKDLFFKRVFSIMYDDLLTVRVNRGILFAAMEFDIKRIEKRLRPVTYLDPKEASMAKKYIMGLLEAKKAEIDMSKLNTQGIREKLEQIGQDQEEAENLF
ncbi:MAG: hypothetical protein ACHQUA_01115 [Microgenomates group bacterium]